MRHLVVPALVCILAGCKDEPVLGQPVATKVLCFQRIEGKELRSFGHIQGPDACYSALEAFLRANPSVRVRAVLPLEYPVEQKPWHAPGTQELIVIHAPSGPGPWVRADELEVEEVLCAASENGQWGPQQCQPKFRDIFATMDPATTVAWIPITDYGAPERSLSGTRKILIVHHRE